MKIEKKGLKFNIREGTSDIKAVNEVVVENNYERKDFKILGGEHWLDMGVNIGAFSVLALSKGCKVTGFEPDPVSCKLADQNIKLNNFTNYKLINKGIVGDNKTQAKLSANVANGNLWRNSIEKVWRNSSMVDVKLTNYKQFIEDDICIKMDIEGSEFLILEDLIQHPELMSKIKKLTFEWSFDIDPSLVRFCNVIDNLKQHFPYVKFGVSEQRYQKVFKQTEKWQKSWFPACLNVYVQR